MNWDGRIRADARQIPLADACVQTIVTSPPYWGLRKYDVEGDQIGMERSPEEYVDKIVAVFQEAKRVLRPDGTLWLNLGDTFWSQGGAGGTMSASGLVGGGKRQQPRPEAADPATFGRWNRTNAAGIKSKDLVGIPWMVAFALRADGWYLRSDIIWAKPNPMPESVTDRPTRAHEYMFLLSKSERYFYDAEAIQEPASHLGPNGQQHSPYAQGFARRTPEEEATRRTKRHSIRAGIDTAGGGQGRGEISYPEFHRNKRDVWTVPTRPYPDAHYATFPPKLIEPCILAGSRPGDIVLDPFFGSGTVGMVAESYGRRWIGIDLGYQEMQGQRLATTQRRLL